MRSKVTWHRRRFVVALSFVLIGTSSGCSTHDSESSDVPDSSGGTAASGGAASATAGGAPSGGHSSGAGSGAVGGSPSGGQGAGGSGGSDPPIGGGIATGGASVSGGVGGVVAGSGGAELLGGGTSGGPAGGGSGASAPMGGSAGASGGSGGISLAGGSAGTGGVGVDGGSSGAGGLGGGSQVPLCEPQSTLKAAAECTGRLVGAALSTQHLGESAYDEAAREHNYVTPENEMKWDAIEPSRGQFSFGGADQIVSFAEQNGMKLKGHALVWHNQLPAWVGALTDPSDVRSVMLNHIDTVVKQYRGRVAAWDVVNEVWQNEETWTDGPALRDYVFPRVLGAGFIDEAFVAARQADPEARLYYNDYRAEGLNAKSDAIYEMVRSMVERGIPLDGVGLQMHMGAPNGNIPLSEIVANMQRIADLGLEVLISEMDIHVCAGQTPEQQREEYHGIVAACVAQPACTAVTFWGITDRYSWLQDEDDTGCPAERDPAGLLWDRDFQKKPAYYGVLDALTGR